MIEIIRQFEFFQFLHIGLVNTQTFIRDIGEVEMVKQHPRRPLPKEKRIYWSVRQFRWLLDTYRLSFFRARKHNECTQSEAQHSKRTYSWAHFEHLWRWNWASPLVIDLYCLVNSIKIRYRFKGGRRYDLMSFHSTICWPRLWFSIQTPK